MKLFESLGFRKMGAIAGLNRDEAQDVFFPHRRFPVVPASKPVVRQRRNAYWWVIACALKSQR
jgi:hypothetical protein